MQGLPTWVPSQVLALTSSGTLLLLLLSLTFMGFECFYPFLQGMERLTLASSTPLWMESLLSPFHSSLTLSFSFLSNQV